MSKVRPGGGTQSDLNLAGPWRVPRVLDQLHHGKRFARGGRRLCQAVPINRKPVLHALALFICVWRVAHQYVACSGSRGPLPRPQRRVSGFRSPQMCIPFSASSNDDTGHSFGFRLRPLAGFIAQINPDIPYSLLAFHPAFLMDDLPRTSAARMGRCHAAARGGSEKDSHRQPPPLVGRGLSLYVAQV